MEECSNRLSTIYGVQKKEEILKFNLVSVSKNPYQKIVVYKKLKQEKLDLSQFSKKKQQICTQK